MLGFLAVLVLLVPCANRFLGPFSIFWRIHPRRGLVYVETALKAGESKNITSKFTANRKLCVAG